MRFHSAQIRAGVRTYNYSLRISELDWIHIRPLSIFFEQKLFIQKASNNQHKASVPKADAQSKPKDDQAAFLILIFTFLNSG